MSTSQKYFSKSQPNVGAMFAAHMKKRRFFIAALARDMGRNPITVGDYRRRPSLQTAILWELSNALKHNFFADIAAQLPATYSTNTPKSITDQERIAELERALELVTAERDLLMKVVGN